MTKNGGRWLNMGLSFLRKWLRLYSQTSQNSSDGESKAVMSMAEGLSSSARLAIETFQKIARLKTRISILEDELLMWASQIPEKDLDTYVRITQNIQAKEDEKLEKHKAKLAKKVPLLY
jgi:hypothetical protein